MRIDLGDLMPGESRAIQLPSNTAAILPLTPRESALVRTVRDKINGYYPSAPPEELPVTAEEFDACYHAFLCNAKEHGRSLVPRSRSGRGILFKNVEIYVP
jgi:hypothetical protein